MKKIYLLLLSGISLSSMYAQITLTATNNNPTIGYSLTTHSFDASSFNTGGTGANVTWNYSSLVSQSSAVATYVAPGTMPDGAAHPTANMGNDNGTVQTFLLVNSNGYSMVGNRTSQTRDVYTNPREFYKFPITYLNSFNESFSGTNYNFSSTQTFQRGGTIQIESDAYGTLVMPYGTINNVLRIKTTTNYGDSMSSSPLITYNDVHYFWFNANTKSFILAYNEFTVLSSTTKMGTYLDQASVITSLGDDFVQNSPILVYPNPTSSIINVSLDKTYANASVRIIDVTGKMVKEELIPLGNKQLQFSAEAFDKGIYFVQIIENNNIISSEKLIVQ